MNPRRKIYSQTIVLVGSFNLKIFHPAWFASEELIGKNEAEDAEIQIIHQDVATFQLNWLKLQVTRERMIAETIQDGFLEPLRDLVIGTLQILSHTPVTAVGINQSMHYEFSKERSWKEVVSQIINENYWNATLSDTVMEKIAFRRTRSDQQFPGSQILTLEPSVKLSNGLYYFFNDHYDIPAEQGKEIYTSLKAEEIISKNWENSLKDGQDCITKIVKNIR